MPTAVHQRRNELCDLLEALDAEQWAAQTLCTGWDAGDIAAHLIVREREPWTGPGLVFGGPAAALTTRRRDAWKARGRRRLIATLRAGPPWPLSGPLAASQIVEDWIHEQDVRRGGAGLAVPTPSDRVAPLLWGATKRIAARTLAMDADLVIELTDGTRRRRLRSRRLLPIATSTSAPARVAVHGGVGELLLFVAGRARAEVEVTGDDEARSILASTTRAL